jgi:hypothetical protein
MTSDHSIKWIENLAEQEGLILSGQLPTLDITKTREEVLAVATSVFLRELKAHWITLSRLFNSRMKDTPLGIEWGTPTEKIDGFYLVRNSVRLSISSSRPGSVQIQCEKVGVEIPTRPSMIFSGVVEARFSNFDEVNWFFLEKNISVEQLARYYLTEFIQSSRSFDHLT